MLTLPRQNRSLVDNLCNSYEYELNTNEDFIQHAHKGNRLINIVMYYLAMNSLTSPIIYTQVGLLVFAITTQRNYICFRAYLIN